MLPGKLCIGILEEDNPLKSYFRLKPLLIENDGTYQIFESEALYPEEGSIRIVPDKNESSHFKARMRRMGRYCVLDLREHSGENDKIRPNKNYRGDDSERNAYIIYSDVVREPAEDMIFEIYDALPEGETLWTAEAPGTPRLLMGESLLPWRYVPADGESGAHLACDPTPLDAQGLQIFELSGFRGEKLRIALRLPGTIPSVIAQPAVRFEEPAVQTPIQPAPAPAAPIVPAAPEPPQTLAAPEAEAPEKPWICKDSPLPHSYIDPRMSPIQRAMAAQCGLNPRRSRSLQEVIEEKWRHSRVDQLGHPVPANATGEPLESPVDAAIAAVQNAWQTPEIQQQLLSSLLEMEDFGQSLCALRTELTNGARKHELEDLEAERLKSLAELDKLRRDKALLREDFKREIRAEEADEFREAVERTQAAQAEYARCQAEVQAAQAAAKSAEDAFAALEDGRFEEKLMDFALTSRAAEILRRAEAPKRAQAKPCAEITREEALERVLKSFAESGLPLSPIEGANLLVCALLTPRLILSGPAGSDKRRAARALAGALGAQHFAEVSAEGDAPDCSGDAPLVCFIQDANALPESGLFLNPDPTAEDCLQIAAVLDAGFGLPVSAEVLESSFFVRLEPVGADAPWQPVSDQKTRFEPADLNALRARLLREAAEIPPALDRRLGKIRAALNPLGVLLSRDTLDLMWHYCAAMLAYGGISPAEALDLAFAQKALPAILAEAPINCLIELKNLLSGMPHSLALMSKPLPIMI